MSLHADTALVLRRSRLSRIATVATASAAAVAATVIIAADQPVPQVRTIAASSRYFDLEANKAAGIRALGHHMATQQRGPGGRYFDLEANKVAGMRALAQHMAMQRPGPGARYFDLEANKAGAVSPV